MPAGRGGDLVMNYGPPSEPDTISNTSNCMVLVRTFLTLVNMFILMVLNTESRSSVRGYFEEHCNLMPYS